MDALMARLQAGDTTAFEQLAKALTSPDNAARGQAEEFYKELFNQKADVGVRYLCQGLSDAKPDMKHFCCVYLRKAVRGTGVWDACSAETKELVKVQSVKCLAEEKNPALMGKLADCVSQVAAQTWSKERPEERWTGVLQHMQQFITSEDPHKIEIALVLFSKLTEWMDQEDLLQNQTQQMYNMLARCLQHSTMNVQLAACRASINFIASFEDNNQKLNLDGLVPPMFTVVSSLLQSGEESHVRDILLDLLDIAETEPRLFKRNCREHLAMLLAIMSGRDPAHPSEALDSETRASAMELVVTLVESRPGLVRKDEQQMRAICEGLMALLLEIEDTREWHAAIEEEDLDDGQSELYEGALQGLDRIAKPIGGKFLLASLWPVIEQWAADGSDWRKRAGALCAIAQVAEGCRKALLPNTPLEALMKICCGAVSDNHAIVKWSACQALGQICTDLATKVQRKHHESIMKALMHLMGGSEEPRVQSHAASAIVNFCEGLGEDEGGNIIGHYLAPLSERLLVLLQSGNQLAVEAALTATSSIADGVGELFKPYYGATMPLLKHILTSANDRTQRRLCGKALECISLIAMSVGKETFAADAHDFLRYLQALNTVEMADDDPLVTYVQSAGTRMCKCLAEDFVQFLPSFVPPLMKSAGKKMAYQMVNADEVDDDEDPDYNSFRLGDQIFRVATAGTEEKANALSMLSCYAEHMEEHFAPYCMQIGTIVEHVLSAPLLNTENMRRTCANLVPQLLKCMQGAVANNTWPEATMELVLQLFELLMKGLLAAMDCEIDLEVLHELYTALEETLDDADSSLLTPALRDQCFLKIEEQVKRLLASRQDRMAEKADADFDEEDLELLNEQEEQEEELMQQVASAIGSFLKRMGNDALESVERLMQQYFNPIMMDPSRRPDERWVPLLVVSDCIEYASNSAKHLNAVLPQLVTNTQSELPPLVQVCVYTLGVIAEKHPSVYAQHHSQLLPIILKVIEKNSEDEDWQLARDNAIGALGRILFHHEQLTSGAPGAQLGTLWLNCLPLYTDEDEAGKNHEMLHQFLLRNDARIIGDNNANLPKIAEVFVKVIGRSDSLLSDERADAFVQFFLQQMRPVLEAHGCNLQELVRQLEPGDQYRFTARLNGSA